MDGQVHDPSQGHPLHPGHALPGMVQGQPPGAPGQGHGVPGHGREFPTPKIYSEAPGDETGWLCTKSKNYPPRSREDLIEVRETCKTLLANAAGRWTIETTDNSMNSSNQSHTYYDLIVRDGDLNPNNVLSFLFLIQAWMLPLIDEADEEGSPSNSS